MPMTVTLIYDDTHEYLHSETLTNVLAIRKEGDHIELLCEGVPFETPTVWYRWCDVAVVHVDAGGVA